MPEPRPLPLTSLALGVDLSFISQLDGELARKIALARQPQIRVLRDVTGSSARSFVVAPVTSQPDDPAEAQLANEPITLEWVDESSSRGVEWEFSLAPLQELVLGLPDIAGIKFVIPSQAAPRVVVTLRSGGLTARATTALGLRFPASMLTPLRRVMSAGATRYEIDNTKDHVDVSLAEVAVLVDTDRRLTFDGAVAVDFGDQAVMLGDSGIVLDGIRATVNLSGDGPRPAGTPDGWKGLLIEHAKLAVPSVFDGNVEVTGLGIGSGGVSGSLSLDLALNYDANAGTFTGDLAGEVFGMPGGIQGITLDLLQNVPVGGGIRAKLLLPFFDETDQPLDVDISLLPGGDVAVALHSDTGLLTLKRQNIVDLTVQSAEFALADGIFTVTLSGDITPRIADVNWPTFHIDALSIDSKGHVKLDGGWIDLTDQVSFDFHGFQVEVTKLGLGTDDDGWRWIGLSGSVHFVEDLEIGGSVEGLKIKWKGSQFAVEVKGIGVDLVIPDTLGLHGKVEFISEGTKHGFKGGVQLTLMPMNLTVDAQLLIGRNEANPAYTFAYVFLEAELPTGIPLLSTGLSFYGFAGLVGYNVAPKKEPSESWFEGWYMRAPVGISGVDKWRDQRGGFALGAGVIIGTASDNGYAFHGRFLLVLVLPGPLILLDGKATFLKERGDAQEVPNIYSLAVFDGSAGTLLFNLQAHFMYQEGGDLIDITGFAEAFFDFASARNWHLYLGMDTPEEKRIRAKIISIFEANSYFMLMPTGVRMGAWFGLNRKWKYGPLRVTLQAWIEGASAVSWAPKQFDGSLTFNGDVGLKAFGYGVGIQLYSHLEASAPRPYRVHAEFKVKLRLPWPLPDPKAKDAREERVRRVSTVRPVGGRSRLP